MRPARLASLLLALLLSGCGEAPPEAEPSPAFVDPPLDEGGFAPCASQSAQQLAMGFTAESTRDAGGRLPGLHRVDDRTFLWVWASYQDTQREDRVSRVNEVQTYREPDGRLVVCTRVELVTPMEVDGERRTYDVAARFRAHQDVPDAPLRFVVNWVAGCGPCGPPPSGNTTADF